MFRRRPGGWTWTGKRLRPYLPNKSTDLALVSMDSPARAHWPLVLVQLVGGKTWSISFVRYATPRPVRTEGVAT